MPRQRRSARERACRPRLYHVPMVLVIAHRGASGRRPEHTRSAYALALGQGAGALEPDLVPTKDGILVIRHEPEISGTTDVADHPEFADRRRTIRVPREAQPAGDPIGELTGWFTFDFTWDELATLRARERLPELRPESAAHDAEDGILRFTDLLELLERTDPARRPDGAAPAPILVAELKHPSAFGLLGYDLAGMFLAELAGRVPAERLVVECFELPILVELHGRGLAASYVHLSESPVELGALPGSIDGVSYAKALLIAPGGEQLVRDAHDAGLAVYTWTLRPENAFLAERFRTGEDPAAWGDWRAEYAAILSTGVDGVFADHPDLVAEIQG